MSVYELPNTILLIEDNEANLKLLKTMIRMIGCESVSFTTGEAACKWCESNKPSLVLCDIMLPGMNGSEVLRELRTIEHLRDVPIVAVTAVAMEGDKERLLADGFDEYIAKPLNFSSFQSTVKDLLSK